MQFQRIGIVSGVEDELASFLPDQTRRKITDLSVPIDAVTLGDKEVFLICAGIGKVAAATAAALLHAHCGVELLAVVGTAGKIGRIEGDLFNITEAVQADYGAQRPEGLIHYTAGSWPIGPSRLQAFEAMELPVPALPTARIATSDLFVECSQHAERVHTLLGATLVDMETAAVAQTAQMLGLPWVAIKATTDEAGNDSAGSFVANLKAAARASAAALEDALARI
jgi:adenosylhomocysteine nucleosidase